jgi:hypothetical protein
MAKSSLTVLAFLVAAVGGCGGETSNGSPATLPTADASTLFYPSPQFYLDDEPPQVAHGVAPRRQSAFTPRLLRRTRTWIKSSLPERAQTLMREASIDWRVSRRGPNWVWTKVPEDRVELFRAHLRALIGGVRPGYPPRPGNPRESFWCDSDGT